MNKFSGGIVNDLRDPSTGVAKVVSNFDINTSPNRLIPYRSSEDGNSNSANDTMQNFCIAKNTSSPTSANDYSLFGLGRLTASDKVRIFKKNLSTGASTDLDDNTWTETANNVGSAVSTVNYNLFIYYPRLGMIFGAHGNRYIYEYDPDGGTAMNETDADLTAFTNIAQGIVHSKDDILYVPYDNKIAKNDNGTWTVAALTLPTQVYITSICEYGNYIAVATAPISGLGSSRVYIWDRDSSLTTLTENIDWGDGIIKVIEEMDGFLIGISSSAITGGSTPIQKNKITFKYYTGAGAKSFFELEDEAIGTQSTILRQNKQKYRGRLHFMMSIYLNGSLREGVWSFGKNGDRFNLVHERTANNDTAIQAGGIRGFLYVGDYLFISSINASSAYIVMKTDDGATYSATSIFETVINPEMKNEDKIKLKQLTSISIGYRTRSAVSGQVVVKYRVDNGSYVTVCTCTTTGTNVLEFKDAVGVPFTKGREYEFRLESTLGAEIINFEYDYSVIPTLS